MVNVLHKNLVAPDAIHPAAFAQTTDPLTVGAHCFWVDTSSGPPFQLKKRNAANTGWDAVGSVGISDPTTTRGDLITRGASALGRFALGVVNSVLISNGTDPVWSTSPTLAGEVTATDFKATGLTGAVSASRHVGGTTSGAPLTGTFAVGDFLVDQTGKLWVCTGAGTPGSWVQTSGNMSNPMISPQDIITGGIAGAPARVAVGANSQVLTVTAGVVGWANSASGFSNPMLSPGDLVSATVGGAPVRVPVGANTQILTVTGGLVGWANPPGGGGGTNNTVASSLFLAKNYI
jgi:hypothetical protein